MAIEFVCPACGGTLQVGDDSAGRVVRCGACLTALTVPGGPAPAYNPYEVERPAPPPPAPRRSRDTSPAPDESRDRRRRDPSGDRPRRRRPPEAPPGRGVFFWLVVVGAVVLLGTIGCCGGVFLLLPDAEWRPHESKEGGFRADFPARPQRNAAKSAGIVLKDGKDVQSEGAALPKRMAAQFIVLHHPIPPEKERLKRQETDERVIEREIRRLLDAMQNPDQRADKPPTGDPSPLGGFDGREVKFIARTGFYTARVIVADSRVFIVVAGGGTTDWEDEDVQRFLRSFEITDKELLDAGQKRAAKKKGDGPKDDAKRADPKDEPKEAAPKVDEPTEVAPKADPKNPPRDEADERRAAELRAWAEAFGGAAVRAGLEARPVPKVEPKPRPRLPVAPPPRPVVVED